MSLHSFAEAVLLLMFCHDSWSLAILVVVAIIIVWSLLLPLWLS